MLLLHALRESRHFRLRLRDRHAWFHSRNHAQVMGAAFVFAQVFSGEGDRFPDFSLVVGESKTRRRDADDGVALSVERDAPANDGRVASESPPPQSVTQNHHTVVSRPILFIEKGAPQSGLNVEQREEAGRNEGPDDSLRLTDTRQVEAR